MNRFVTLLKREYWENRGGFFWAPVIAGAIFLTLALLFGATGVMFGKKHHPFKFGEVEINAERAISKVDAEQIGYAMDFVMMSGAFVIGIIMLVVIFFYCLGALYDDRKDRSILFWKSLPISDRETVFAKLFTAGIGAPVIALVMGLIIGVLLMFVMILLMSMVGVNLFGIAFTHTHPFQLLLKSIALLPLCFLWSLPSIAWYLFCSAWAKSKPFLWAVLVPVMSGILFSWMDFMPGVNVDSDWYWSNVVYRLLFSIVPGSAEPFLSHAASAQVDVDGPKDLFMQITNLSSHYSIFTHWQMWAGLVVGAALIYGAIYFRKHRELAD